MGYGWGCHIKDELLQIKNEFESIFKERAEEINCALLAILSGEHVLFLGPPGTAKSLLSKNVCEIMDGQFFYYLLTRFTTPEELYGPLSLKALQQDDFHRKIDGYLPTASIAFLDEIFKSNSSILNSLLTILNERKFHNGSSVESVPLVSVFAASNELPEENESLEALYDRFLFRCSVRYVQDESNFADLIFADSDLATPSSHLTLDAVRGVQARAGDVAIDPDVRKIILETRRELITKGVQLSDRRWKKMIKVLRIAAAGIGHKSVDRSMVLLLQHMAWDRPEQKEHIKNILMDLIISGGESLGKLKKEADDLQSLVQRSVDFKFPMRIRCFNCSEVLENSKQLYIHKTLYPDHLYYDPYRISLHLRYFNYSDLLSVLQNEYSWNFVESTPQRIRSYSLELESMKERFGQARVKVEGEIDTLKSLLDRNIWVAEGDKAEVINRCENNVGMLERIHNTFKIIESMIERDGQVGFSTESMLDEATAQ
jgi:MoxR-like ATPase